MIIRRQQIRLLVFSLFIVITAVAQSRHGLIFTIGNYPERTGTIGNCKIKGWRAIASNNDLAYVKSFLQNQGFEDIEIVTDSSATKKGIGNALDALLTRVKPGDIVVIHFSSHGEQLQDDNGDEADGLDEAIVPYDAVLPDCGGAPLTKEEFDKFQENYFRDDELGKYIDLLRARLGRRGDLLLFMDLCHSGTGTRGNVSVRGGAPPLVTKDFVANKNAQTESFNLYNDNLAMRGNDSDLSSYVVYSAAEPDELDYETDDDNVPPRRVGSLSYATSKVFANLDRNLTYRSLFAKIQAIMNEKSRLQHPVLEGNGIDRALFGGAFKVQTPYFQIDTHDGSSITIHGGRWQGLDSGARIALYPPGTLNAGDTTKMIMRGMIVQASGQQSAALLDKDLTQTAQQAWVFVTNPVYEVEAVNVGIQSALEGGKNPELFFSKSDVANIKKSLARLDRIQFTDISHCELSLLKGHGEDSLKLASNGYRYAVIRNTNNTTDTLGLQNVMKQYIQYKFLQRLILQDSSIDVEVKLLPFVNKVVDSSVMTKDMVKTYSFKEGDQFVLWIRNGGFTDVYVNILDMQPDGIINAVLPSRRAHISPESLKIPAGTAHLFSQNPIRVSPPYGTEIFKIFVSREKIDMEDIATTKGNGTRGNFSVLESLVRKSFGAGQRGGDITDISGADGSTFNILFLIEPGN